MTAKTYLAVDLGAESGRTVVAKFDGSKLSLEETHRFPNQPVRVRDTLYWDVLRLWHEIKTGITRSVSDNGVPTALGIDTWGVDFGFVDSHGGLVSNPVHYRDSRTDGIFDEAFRIVPKAEIYDITGLQFLQFNSLFQLLALAKQGRQPPTGSRLLFMPDLLNYFLTGEIAAEYTIASTSQLLDAKSRTWSADLLERFGIPIAILPSIVETGSALGTPLASVVAETGLAGTQVIATAGHDTAAAIAAVPASAEKWCYISSGTWSLMGAEINAPSITAQGLAANFTNEGGYAGTIRYLKNIMGLWLVQECRRSFARRGTDLDYATLARLAEEAKPFVTVLDPDDPTFLKPVDMPTAIAEFCRRHQQPVPENEGALVRACLESLALRYRRTLAQLEEVVGHPLEVIHIVGGGCQNELLCQLTADCCQRTVVAGPVEATAIGNCLVQMISSGEIADLREGRAIVRQSFPTKTYEPQKTGAWDEPYARFSKLIG